MLIFRRRKNYRFLWIFILTVILLSGILAWLIFRLRRPPQGDLFFGVTFSQKYAEELGLDWREVYEAALSDLGVRHFRLTAYWDLLEPSKGKYNFTDLDWQIKKAREYGAHVILAFGRRVPRWPECHIPSWVNSLTEEEQDERVLDFLRTIVLRYRSDRTVAVWQVENEPFLSVFGICPPLDKNFFASEVALVRELDSTRPIMTTESGELSTWFHATRYADIIGVSMYRVTWNKYLGYFYYPISPYFYRYKARLLSWIGKRVFVSELQAEPWTASPILSVPLAEQYRSMDVERFRHTLRYARATGFDEVYLWGVEWWYWLKSIGNDEIWDTAKTVF